MITRRFIAVLALFVCLFPVLISCKSEQTDPYEEEYDYLANPEKVDEYPISYIPFDEAIAEGGDIMTYDFFETQIFILDEEGNTICSAPVYKGGMIVDYQGTYYINKVRHDAALAQAKERSEELNRDYAPGETVRLRSELCRYFATIDAVSQDQFTIHLEQYNETISKDYSIESFLSHVETAKGKTITDFSVDDSGTVSVDIADDDQIKKIVLKIPETNRTRVIVIP